MLRIAILIVMAGLATGCASGTVAIDYGDAQESQASLDLQWPVYGAIVTQKFRPEPKRFRRRHIGIDLAAPKGSPIYAVDHGIVVYAGHGFSGYGRLVIVEHLNREFRSYYAHLNRYKVEKGDVVKKGDLIGLMGSSGRSTGVHLHFELRQNDLALNPLDFLPPTEAAGSLQASPQP